MNEREEGFYWIVRSRIDDTPEVAEWFDGQWFLVAGEVPIPDEYVIVVSPRLDPPSQLDAAKVSKEG